MSNLPPGGNASTQSLQQVSLSTIITPQQPQPPPATRSIQVQVLSTPSQTPSSSNGTLAGVAKAMVGGPAPAPASQDIHTQLASVAAGIQLTPEKLLQLYSQQFTQTAGGRGVGNASLILQPGATLKVVSTAPPSSSATTISTGQFASGYQGEASVVVTQPQLMGMHQQHPSNVYYDHQQIPQHGIGHMGLHQAGGDITPPLTHTTRAHPQTIQWLLDNYETAEGVSLPRSTLYNHYLRHCAANKIDAVNAASFGKLIRSVFIGLKTRRLGTRGNSKYHYYGIRIKPDSVLSTFPQEDSPTLPMRQLPQSTQNEYPSSEAAPEGVEAAPPPEPTPQQLHHQYLGESRPELPLFPEVEWAGTPIPGAVTSDDLSDFTALYREHCEAILDVVVNLQFQMVENLWHHFWDDTKSPEPQGPDDEDEQPLPREKLLLLTSCQPVLEYLSTCDHILYQCIADFLVPDVLRPIPGTLTQAIRNFAKSLETWLTNTIQGYPSVMVKSKICSVVAFSQTLRRYTSLNHLAQAARAVLQNSSQISQMLNDLNRVDFVNVHEQASWVCECDESLVIRLEQDFKATLQQQKTLEEWATWLEDVVSTVLEPYENGPQFSKAARQFLLKWSFYSSMVIRDLTLRSAASFGSFHLIRLLYDEYMFFLIEHKVAKAAGKTPIAVMTEFSGHSRSVFAEGMPLLPLVDPLDQENEDEEDQEPQAKRPKY